jgi:hypothetical protein
MMNWCKPDLIDLRVRFLTVPRRRRGYSEALLSSFEWMRIWKIGTKAPFVFGNGLPGNGTRARSRFCSRWNALETLS